MQHTFKAISLALVCAFSANSAAAASNEAYPAKYTLKKGEKYAYSIKNEMNQSMQMMGQEQEMKATITVDMQLQVQDANPNKNVIDVKFNNAKMHVVAGGKDTTMNFEEISALNETIEMDSKGKTLNRKKTSEKNSSDMKAILSQMGGNFGGISAIIFELPEKDKLEKGFTWVREKSDTNQLGDQGKIITKSKVNNFYEGTVDTLGATFDKFSFKSEKLTIDGEINQMGMEIKVEGDGVIKGIAFVDRKTGLPNFIQSNTSTDTFMKMSGMQDMPPMPMSMEIKSVARRTK